MNYKVKIEIVDCFFELPSVKVFLTVPQSEMHRFFEFGPLDYSLFSRFVSPRTASRYRRYFNNGACVFTLFDASLIFSSSSCPRLD